MCLLIFRVDAGFLAWFLRQWQCRNDTHFTASFKASKRSNISNEWRRSHGDQLTHEMQTLYIVSFFTQTQCTISKINNQIQWILLFVGDSIAQHIANRLWMMELTLNSQIKSKNAQMKCKNSIKHFNSMKNVTMLRNAQTCACHFSSNFVNFSFEIGIYIYWIQNKTLSRSGKNSNVAQIAPFFSPYSWDVSHKVSEKEVKPVPPCSNCILFDVQFY